MTERDLLNEDTERAWDIEADFNNKIRDLMGDFEDYVAWCEERYCNICGKEKVKVPVCNGAGIIDDEEFLCPDCDNE